MSEIKKEISKMMAGVRKKGLPSSEVIVDETFKKLEFLPDKGLLNHLMWLFR